MRSTRRGRKSTRPRAGSRAYGIAARLEAEIIAGKRKPRERLVELEVAAQFAVSRAPVREALRMLEREGLVAAGPRGVFVADISRQDVSDIFEIVAHLEELYTRTAAPRLTTRDFDAMQRTLRDMERAVTVNDVGSYFDLNIQFHAVIRGACPNRRLIGLLESLGKQTLRFRRLAVALAGRLPVSLEEHRRILEACRQGNGVAAGRFARASAEAAFESLVRFLDHGSHVV